MGKVKEYVFKKNGAKAPFIIEITTTTANQSVTFPMNNSTNNFTLDYGDGSPIVKVVGTGDVAKLTKTYASIGAYTVTITGVAQYFNTQNTASFRPVMTKIIKWGATDFTAFMAYLCNNLTTMPTVFEKDDDITTLIDVTNMFRESKILSNITTDLFKGCVNITTASNAFNWTIGIPSYPSNLVSGLVNVTSLNSFFANTYINSIPSGFFDYNTELTDLGNCFYNCRIQGAIPTGLFDYNTKLLSVAGTFQINAYGIGITSTPATLLANCPLINNVSALHNRNKLTVIPAGYFNAQTLCTSFASTFGYNLFSSIPPNLFDTNPNANYFSNCFQDNPNLLSFPPTLFNGFAVTGAGFNSVFTNCPKLASEIPAGMFNSMVGITSLTSTFFGCALTGALPPNIFDFNVNLVTMSGTFCRCKLTSLPAQLFINNPSINTFAEFITSSALTSLPADLFNYTPNVTSLYNCFAGSPITSLPIGLLNNLTNLSTVQYAFSGCRMSSLDADLFRYNTKITNFSNALNANPYLLEIPVGLFKYNTLAANFQSCFQSCTNLTTIPSTLLDDVVSITAVLNNFFYLCGNVTSAVPTLWITRQSASHALCFRNLTLASNYASIPADWI